MMKIIKKMFKTLVQSYMDYAELCYSNYCYRHRA